MNDNFLWVTVGTFCIFSVLCSFFKGPERFTLDLKGLKMYINQERDKYIVVALLGTVKGEHQS